MRPPPVSAAGAISSIEHRVNYSETDQMGLVYHARYLVWLDMARTEHLRHTGMTYKALETQGLYLAVTEVHIRYRLPARYDDLVKVRCWVREIASRRVRFGYAVDRATTEELLATAETALIALNHQHELTRIPDHVRERLQAIPDQIRQ